MKTVKRSVVVRWRSGRMKERMNRKNTEDFWGSVLGYMSLYNCPNSECTTPSEP